MYRAITPRKHIISTAAILFPLITCAAHSQVCTVTNQDNCQTANAGTLISIDRYHGPNVAVADDFIALGSEISEFCWEVGFLPSDGSPPCHHFPDTNSPPSDHFNIYFYEDADGLPGALIHGVSPAIPDDKEWHGPGFVTWDYTITFDPPLDGFVPGQKYWVAINAFGNLYCTVHGVQSVDGNGFMLAERNELTWSPYWAQTWDLEDRTGDNLDLAFCMGGNAAPSTDIPLAVTGACCQCDGICTDSISWSDCLGFECLTSDCGASCPAEDPVPPCNVEPLFDRATFFPDQECTEIVCEDYDTIGAPGDDCGNPIIAPSSAPGEIIEISINTQCTTTDGPVTYPNGCESGDVNFVDDVWIEYTTVQTGRAQFYLCGTTDFDSAVAIYTNGTATCPNVNELTGQRTICPPPLADLVTVLCNDDLCGEYLGVASVDECVIKNQCFLIRIGGNNDSGAGALLARSRSSSCVASESPFAEMIEDAQGQLVANVKNRVLSFTPWTFGQEAIRVKFESLPGAHSNYNGQSLWVGPPVEYDETASIGYGAPCDDACQPGDNSCSLCSGETFWSAELQCEPFYFDWSNIDVVHVRDPLIVPSTLSPGGSIADPALYHIAAVHESCCPDFSEASFSFPPLEITMAGWGDVAELFNGQYVAPDQRITVFDTLAMLQAFAGIPDDGNLLSKVRADLLGVDAGGVTATVDGAITISDLVQVLAAFGGGAFGFNPGPWPCP